MRASERGKSEALFNSLKSYKSRSRSQTISAQRERRCLRVQANSKQNANRRKTILTTLQHSSVLFTIFIYLRFRALNASVLKFEVKYGLKNKQKTQQQINPKLENNAKQSKNNGTLAKNKICKNKTQQNKSPESQIQRTSSKCNEQKTKQK